MRLLGCLFRLLLRLWLRLCASAVASAVAQGSMYEALVTARERWRFVVVVVDVDTDCKKVSFVCSRDGREACALIDSSLVRGLGYKL